MSGGTKHEGAGSKSAQDKRCELCFGPKGYNETFIYMDEKTICQRCADKRRAKIRATHPRDIEYKKWLTKHKMKR